MASFTAGFDRLDMMGGVVPDGGTWTPGAGVDPDGGRLFIDVVPNSDPGGILTSFAFKETPTPEPAGLALMLLGGAAMLARRR